MYLFDLEDSNGLNCNEVPSDWGSFINRFEILYGTYMKCIRKFISSNSETLPAHIASELNDLWLELRVAYDAVMDELGILINALGSAPLNCLDKSLYANYMVSYNAFKDISQKINILLTTGGDTIGIQPDISVESTTIYPTDGITKPKTTRCVGVYMKQMDNGSEFIGKVTDDTPIVTTRGSERGRDGRIIIG